MRKRKYIDREVLDSLYAEFVELATERLKPDCGDLSIDIHILDRTRYDMDQYEPVPYEDRSCTEEEYEQVFCALISNLNTASEALSRWSRGGFTIKRSGVSTATDRNLADENRELVKENKDIGLQLYRLRQDQGAIIRKDESVKRARKQREEVFDAMRHFWRCESRNCDECMSFKEKHHLDDR